MTLNIQGTNKSIVIDLTKLKDCITFQDKTVDEKNASAEDYMTKVDEIDLTNITEDDFIKQAVEKIGAIEKNESNTKILSKDCFVKIFKYVGDFAKIRTSSLKASAQADRCQFFNTDHNQYLDALRKTIMEEEKAYEKSSEILFEKLSISPEMFERSQQVLMQDPALQMELFQLGIKMEQPAGKAPEDLKKDMVIDLVKKSNDFAFDLFKKQYLSVMNTDPMIMPVLISAIAHDWVFKNHNWSEDQFKASLFEHKIYEDPSVAQHMQSKQFELMMIAQQQNPMMGMGMGMPQGGMGGPPMGGMGMPPDMGGMGGMGGMF